MQKRLLPIALSLVFTALVVSSARASGSSSAPTRYVPHLQMMAEGSVPGAYVLAAPLPELPPLPPGLEFRVRHTFPYQGRDQLDVVVFVCPDFLPVGVFDPLLAPEAVISRFVVRIDSIDIAGGAAYAGRDLAGGMTMQGEIAGMLNPSPFGDLTGLLFTFATGFVNGESATFRMTGGSGAGDHATFAPDASGCLHIGRPWTSH